MEPYFWQNRVLIRQEEYRLCFKSGEPFAATHNLITTFVRNNFRNSMYIIFYEQLIGV